MAKEKARKIPKTLYLGPGWEIQIKLVAPAILAATLNEPLPPHSDSAGGWIKEHRTIYLDDSLALARLWRVLRAELTHALIDSLEEMSPGGGL